ncbi:MAG: type III secretion system export apparatus subunit SctV [Pseudomonadales bacterium]|nr:type III secretion system export apparatus subunit SctV [Pseudomonadales bacterium]
MSLSFLSPKKGVSDIVLAFSVVAIVALMILPLPLFVADTLVAVNILIAITLLLLAIYVPTPTAFSSFPSVLLLSTLFRLSLSIATTRLILLEADAGQIIKTFGTMVAGGNMVVGVVVFLIITVVQFIVIAKGSERVAEVSARFTLDAMPGKQMSIDSDLRSGVIDKEEMLRRRDLLESESQMNGALDGAMKFVKGDAIAGIIIVIVNIIGGLAIGVMQHNMDLHDAVQTYSILTIGDGLVSQIPALLASISAGLIITRTSSEDEDTNLGKMITQQITAHPKVITLCGVFSLLFTFVPGFPWLVFLMIGITLLAISFIPHAPEPIKKRFNLKLTPKMEGEQTPKPSSEMSAPPPIILTVESSLLHTLNQTQIQSCLDKTLSYIRDHYGVPIPTPQLVVSNPLSEKSASSTYALTAHGIGIGFGTLMSDHSFQFLPYQLPLSNIETETHKSEFLPFLNGQWIKEKEYAGAMDKSNNKKNQNFNASQLLTHHLTLAFKQNLGLFLGIQEASNLVTLWNTDYPDLIKEMLRVVTPQTLTELLRRLLREDLPIRNLRAVFEAITDAGSRERDIVPLTEQVRIALKQHISDRFSGPQRQMKAILIHPELEETLVKSMSTTPQQIAIDPDRFQRILHQLRETRVALADDWSKAVLVVSMEIRRPIRQLIEDDFFTLPVLSYQELTGDIQIDPIGQLKG